MHRPSCAVWRCARRQSPSLARAVNAVHALPTRRVAASSGQVRGCGAPNRVGQRYTGVCCYTTASSTARGGPSGAAVSITSVPSTRAPPRQHGGLPALLVVAAAAGAVAIAQSTSYGNDATSTGSLAIARCDGASHAGTADQLTLRRARRLLSKSKRTIEQVRVHVRGHGRRGAPHSRRVLVQPGVDQAQR